MQIKGNLLFSNQVFVDEAETVPIVINLDAITYIGGCQITNGLIQGKKVNVVFDDSNRVVLDENMEDVVMELWRNHGEN